MTDQRRKKERYDVHLSVRYNSAEQFVSDYVENLSEGGLFVLGAHVFPIGHEADVEIVLPGQGTWTVRARVVFSLGEIEAEPTGRNAGAGMELVAKPEGFDDALLGYLLRLGRRRDSVVMLADVPGGKAIERSGYRVIPLADPASIARLAEETAGLVALVVPEVDVEGYRELLRNTAIADRIFGVTKPNDIPDVIARIDSLL